MWLPVELMGITEQELRSLFEYGLVVYFHVVTSFVFLALTA